MSSLDHDIQIRSVCDGVLTIELPFEIPGFADEPDEGGEDLEQIYDARRYTNTERVRELHNLGGRSGVAILILVLALPLLVLGKWLILPLPSVSVLPPRLLGLMYLALALLLLLPEALSLWRQFRPQGARPQIAVRSRASLGIPQAVRITARRVRDDDDLRHFVEEESANFKFHLVHLACSFRPAERERFSRARLDVQLMRTDGVREPQPIAWSMQPIRLEDITELSRTVKLGATLKVMDLGVELGIEESKRRPRKELMLQAFNELQPDPGWEFRRTGNAVIYGTQRFILVVRSPTEPVIQVVVRLTGTIEKKIVGMPFGPIALPPLAPRHLGLA